MFKYTNAFLLELGLLAFGVLGPIWNVLGQEDVDRPSVNNSDGNTDLSERENMDGGGNAVDDDDEEDDLNTMPRFMALRAMKKILIFVSNYALIFTLLLILPVLVIHIISEVKKMIDGDSDVIIETVGSNKTVVTSLREANFFIQTIYNYIVSVMPVVGYVMVRNKKMPNWRQNSNIILLIVGGFGHLVLVLFETADSIVGFVSKYDQKHQLEEILFFVKILFHYIGIYFQVLLIMKGIHVASVHGNSRRLQGFRAIIIFLGVCNSERWLVDTFLPPTNLRFVKDIQKEDPFGMANWWTLTQILYPQVTFFRLISALLFFEVIESFHNTGT